jgi:hypothetical protein
MAASYFLRVFETGSAIDAAGASLGGFELYDLLNTPSNTPPGQPTLTLDAWLAAEGGAGHFFLLLRANSSLGKLRVTVVTTTDSLAPGAFLASQASVKVWVERGAGLAQGDTGFVPQMSSFCYVPPSTDFTDDSNTLLNFFSTLAAGRLVDVQTVAAEGNTIIVTVEGPAYESPPIG